MTIANDITGLAPSRPQSVLRRLAETLRAVHPREVAIEGLSRLDEPTRAAMGIRDRRGVRRFVAGLF